MGHQRYQKRHSLSLSAMRIHSEKAATCRLGRGLSQELDHASTLISDFQPPQMGENKLLLFKLKAGKNY